jgi:hypothetical protein
MNIVFAWGVQYDSYVDYYKLVELAGFQTCHVYDVDFTREDTVYIISPHTGEWRPHWENWRQKPHRAITILWNLERPGNTKGLFPYIEGTKQILNDSWFDYIWLSDRWLTEQVYDSRCLYVPLGSHVGLGTLEKLPIQYDVCHFSCNVPRRRNLLRLITGKVAGEAMGEERDKILRSSRFMLNIHQDDWPIIEPLRFALAAAYGLPILSEQCSDCYPYNRIVEGQYIWMRPYYQLQDQVNALLTDESCFGEMQAMGHRAHDLMTTEFEFGRIVRNTVAQIELDRPVNGLIIR